MKTFALILVNFILGSYFSNAQFNYPATKTVEVKETHWGVTIEDPYRWLEDIKNPEVVDWMKAQANFTNTQMAKIPNQDKLFENMKAIDKMKTVEYSPMAKAGGKYFYNKRYPDQQVSKFYSLDLITGKETLIFDPENFVKGKMFDHLPIISEDGSKVILEISEMGNEISDLYIYDVATGKILAEKIPHSSWSGFFGNSNSEFTYIQFKNYDVHDPEVLINLPCKLHKIGTPASEDKIIVSATKNPELEIAPNEFPSIIAYPNTPYMFFGKFTVENNFTLYYALKSEIHQDKINWKSFCTKQDEIVDIAVNGNNVYLMSTKNNPYFNLLKVNMDNPDLKNAKILYKGTEEWKLSKILLAKDYLVLSTSKNELERNNKFIELKSDKIQEIEIAVTGNLHPIVNSSMDNEILLVATNWNMPMALYGYDLDQKKQSKIPYTVKNDFPFAKNLVVKEIEIPSHDGAMVPVSIIYDKTKVKLDGSDIGYLVGYGSYGMSIYPRFIYEIATLFDYGVIIAVAHVRGGGEKGNEWYLAGKKKTKPNTWKDFIATAEYLIQHKYTAKDKLVITGASAGGILVGRAVTERPDLFAAAIPEVGCLNALRMEFSPNGPANIPEFGTVEIEEEFKSLLAMDAYQQTKKGVKYPAQLITTGFNDPRVASYIPAKYAAKMQTLNSSEKPIFLDVSYESGHFGATGIDDYYREEVKKMAFALWQTGHPDFQIK